MADKNLLLVEGKDDEHVFYHLLERHQVPECFRIINKEGIEHLLETLPTELKRSNLKRLGIVVDANTDIGARWAALRNILLGAGNANVPATPDPTGTVVALNQEYRTLTVGVWLMPDNQISGMLEDFVAFLVPPGDLLWSYAEDCLEQMPEQHRRFPVTHKPKAHIHTWLAWQEDPGTPMGLAITKRYLDAEAPCAHQLMNWIRRLFEI